MDTKTRLLKYLSGELSAEAQHEVEEMLADNPTLQDVLSTLQLTQDTAATARDLTEIEQRWQGRQRMSASTHWLLRGAVAALVIFTIWSGTSYFLDQREERLYADFFTATPSDYLAIRGSNEGGSPDEKAAMQAYLAGQYEESLALFSALREQSPYDGPNTLYYGISAMQMGRFQTAQLAFTELIALDMDNADYSAAHWYLALTELQLADESAAAAALQWLIENDRGELGEKAKKLLEELD